MRRVVLVHPCAQCKYGQYVCGPAAHSQRHVFVLDCTNLPKAMHTTVPHSPAPLRPLAAELHVCLLRLLHEPQRLAAGAKTCRSWPESTLKIVGPRLTALPLSPLAAMTATGATGGRLFMMDATPLEVVARTTQLLVHRARRTSACAALHSPRPRRW